MKQKAWLPALIVGASWLAIHSPVVAQSVNSGMDEPDYILTVEDTEYILAPKEELAVKESIRSENGRYELVLQEDGNLVLYRSGGGVLWSTGTNNQVVNRLVMQDDGNLVLYGPGNRTVWSSGTFGHPGSYLVLQDDGNLVIYVPQAPIWSSNTQQ